MQPLQPPPRPVLLLTVATSLVSFVVCVAVAAHAAMAAEAFIAAFAAVGALGCVFGMLIGFGRFRDGPSIALFCTALTLCAAGAAYFIVGRGSGYRLPAVGLRNGAAMFMLLGAAHIGLAGLILLARNPRRSVPLFIKGVVFGIPVLAAAGAALAFPVQSFLGGLHPLVATAVVIVGFFAIVAFIAASAHCLIRAFEIGVQTANAAQDAAAGGAHATRPTGGAGA